MNIHEHQAKEILKKYGVAVPEGVFSDSVEELLEKAKTLKTEKRTLQNVFLVLALIFLKSQNIF